MHVSFGWFCAQESSQLAASCYWFFIRLIFKLSLCGHIIFDDIIDIDNGNYLLTQVLWKPLIGWETICNLYWPYG